MKSKEGINDLSVLRLFKFCIFHFVQKISLYFSFTSLILLEACYYSEGVFREVLDECDVGISLNGERISNVLYAGDTVTVSYTHLDVYKRQLLLYSLVVAGPLSYLRI